MRPPLKVVAASGPLGEDPGAPRELEIEWFSEISSGPPSERGLTDAVVGPEVEEADAEYITVDLSFPPLFRSLLPDTWPTVEPQPSSRHVPAADPATISRAVAAADSATISRAVAAADPATSSRPVPAAVPATIFRAVPAADAATSSRPVPASVPATIFRAVPAADPATSSRPVTAVDPATNDRPVLPVEPSRSYGPFPIVEPARSTVDIAPSAAPAQHAKRRKCGQKWNQHPSDFLVNLVDMAPDLVDPSQINVVLDLDQTLLHTIRLKDLVPGSQLDLSAFWDSKGQPDLELVFLSHELDPAQFPYNYAVINKEAVIFDTRASRTSGGSDNYFVVKLRPFVREFLEQLYQRCNLYVVTNGQKNYGETAVAILDPDHRFFGKPPRLICRSSTDKSQDKTPLLRQLLPGADPQNTLLVDDRLDVYDKAWWPSLLPVVAYNSLRCLVSSIAHNGPTGDFYETDCQLLATAAVIRSVVRAFYGGQSVSAYLVNARRAVKIPPTSLVISNDQPPDSLNLRYSLQRHMWLQAQLRLYTGNDPECFDLKEVLRRGATSKCMVFANHGVIPASSLGALAGTIFSGQWLDIVFSCLQMVEPLTFDVVRTLWEESGSAVRFSWRATKQNREQVLNERNSYCISRLWPRLGSLFHRITTPQQRSFLEKRRIMLEQNRRPGPMDACYPRMQLGTQGKVGAYCWNSSRHAQVMLSSESLVVRVEAPSGRARFEMRKDDLIVSLVEQVATKFGLRAENVVLQKGDDAFDHTCKLRFTHVNLVNGDVLKMTSVDGTIGEMQGVSTGLKACRSTADLAPEKPQASSPAPAGDHTASGGPITGGPTTGGPTTGGPTSGGPAFLSFDEYLHRSMFNIGDLPLLQNFKPRLLERGQLTKVPPSVTLRHQKYRHVDHIEFMNVEAMNKFVTHWRFDLEMSEQRCGYLYGYYREDPHYPEGIRAVVEAIYEPQQVGEVDTCTVLDDDFLPTVTACVEALGLECIGFIYTQLPGNHHATNTEVLRQASLQLEHSSALHYTGYEHSTFVTVTVSPDTDLGGEPVPNAYMVSDLGMAFYRDGLFDKVQPNPNLMNIKQGAPHELFPKVLESGKLIEAGGSFDLDWLLVRVNDSAPKTVNSFFKHNSFPPMNRRRAPTQRDVQTYLKSVSGPDWTRLSDFHFLLYVAHLFDVDTGKAICGCVRNKKVNMSDFLDILNLL